MTSTVPAYMAHFTVRFDFNKKKWGHYGEVKVYVYL
jgi:hypothetical protein